MSVSAAEFKKWLESASLSDSATTLSEATGLNRGTLRNQMLRGSVAETTVIEVARVYGLSPLQALAAFTPYHDLRSEPLMPTEAELLSQVQVADLMAEFQFRTSKKYRGASIRNLPLFDLPHEGSIRAWIDAIDLGDIRKAMTAATGVAAPNIGSQLTDNRLSPALAVAAAKAAGVSIASAFVITGLITPAEGGWPVRAREDALLGVSDAQLVDVIYARIHLLQRKLKQRKEAHEYANKMTELLG